MRFLPVYCLLICLGLISCNSGPQTYIAYSSLRGNGKEVFLLNLQTAKETQVSQGTLDNVRPIFSPDGKHLFFHSTKDNNTDLVHYYLDSGKLSLLTDGPGLETHLSISPDSKWVVYVSQADVFLAEIDGSKAQNISKDLEQDLRPAWHPSGKKIIWHTRRNGNYDLITYDIESEKSEFVASSELNEYNGSWSPDGTVLAYWVMQEKAPQLYIWKEGEAAPSPISELGCGCGDVSWAPNDNRLLYRQTCQDGSTLRIFDAESLKDELVSIEGRYNRPIWGSEGKKIWYEREVRDFKHLYYFELDQKRERPVTAGYTSYFDVAVF